MSEDAQDVTTEAPADEAVAEAGVDTTVEAPEQEAAAEEAPTAEVEETVADDEPAAQEPAAAEESEPVSETLGAVRVARVFVCERGHRTTTLWGTPEVCQARPFRNGAECGMPLYHITELPEQVQKALNPLKASKKASKKK